MLKILNQIVLKDEIDICINKFFIQSAISYCDKITINVKTSEKYFKTI